MLELVLKLANKLTRKWSEIKSYQSAKCAGKLKCYGRVTFLNPNVSFGKNVILYPNVSFEGTGRIYIGNNVKIGTNCIIYAGKLGEIRIGENTIIGGNSYIIDTNHGMKKDILISLQELTSEKLEISDDVWIGASTTIIKGATIGHGAVIGANSTVNSEIPDYAIAVGNPAKIIKYRSK